MDTVLVVFAFIGIVWLLFLGLAILLGGITADEAAEFPFARSRWARPITALALLAVAPVWPVLLPATGAGWLFAGGFLAAAAFMLWQWHRQRKLASPHQQRGS